MVFSPSPSLSDSLSRFAAGAALVLAAGAGLVVAWWVPRPQPVECPPPQESSAILADSTSLPVADIQSVVRFCASHATARRGFVVFNEGTVVLVSEPCADPVAEAGEILRRCAKPDAIFVTEETSSSDLVVTFTEPVFHWVPSKEREPLANWAEKHLTTLFSPAELAKRPGDWTPGPDARIGLLARNRLLEDARSAKVAKIIRPAPEAKPDPPGP